MKRMGLFVVGIRFTSGGQALGESCDWVFAIRLGVSCIFCDCEFLAHLNCGSLVFADSAEQDFLFTAIGIEIPYPVLGD